MGKQPDNQHGFAALEAVLIVVIIGIVGFTGWFVLNAKKNTDQSFTSNSSAPPVYKKKSTTDTTTKTQAPAQAVDKTQETVTAINALVEAGNYTGLSAHMASSVHVVKQGTDYDGNGLGATAAAGVVSSYLTKSGTSVGADLPWDFTTQSTDRTRISQNADIKSYTSQGHIGISANSWVVAYQLNSDLKIDTVFMSVSAELIQ